MLIIEKLRRESIRLSQVQDIAGCRVIVANVRAQDRAVQLVQKAFLNTVVVNRKTSPSHGYRVVHVTEISETLIEIEVRSTLQHLWAEFSERVADKVNPAIKYGGGHEQIRQALSQASELVAEYEDLESKAEAFQTRLRREQLMRLKERIVEYLRQLIFLIDKLN